MYFFLTRKILLRSHRLLGWWGERCTAGYLKGKGYKVLALNYRCRAGEIDLIAKTPERDIVFVEVKTRRDEKYQFARNAVNSGKKKRITAAGKYFLKSKNVSCSSHRFDVVTVVLGRDGKPVISHYENAFVSN